MNKIKIWDIIFLYIPIIMNIYSIIASIKARDFIITFLITLTMIILIANWIAFKLEQEENDDLKELLLLKDEWIKTFNEEVKDENYEQDN